MNNFTLEEIYLIKSCDSASKLGVIQELRNYLNHVDSDMAEIVHNALSKLYKISDDLFAELRNYPAEM